VTNNHVVADTGGHEISLEATIAKQSERNEAGADESATQQRASFRGMVLNVLTPEVRRLPGGTAPANGVVVTQIQAWNRSPPSICMRAT